MDPFQLEGIAENGSIDKNFLHLKKCKIMII